MFYLPESCQKYGVYVYYSKVWSHYGRMQLGWGFYSIWTGNARVWCTGPAQWLLPVVWACSVRVIWVRWPGTHVIWCNMAGNNKNCIPLFYPLITIAIIIISRVVCFQMLVAMPHSETILLFSLCPNIQIARITELKNGNIMAGKMTAYKE